MVPASAVPLMVGVASFVVDPEVGAVMVGLVGPDVSTVRVTGSESSLILPATSAALTVRV